MAKMKEEKKEMSAKEHLKVMGKKKAMPKKDCAMPMKKK